MDTPLDAMYCDTEANRVLTAYTVFFRATQEHASAQWTQFKLPHMAVGLFLLAASLIWVLWRTSLAFSALALNSNKAECRGSGIPLRRWLLVCAPLGAAFNSMAAYSDNFTEQVTD